MKWLLIIVLMLVAACSEPKFNVGQRVETIISGQSGMIIRVWNCFARPCRYDVRFGGLQINTNTRLLGYDGPVTISPLIIIRAVHWFELKAIK